MASKSSTFRAGTTQCSSILIVHSVQIQRFTLHHVIPPFSNMSYWKHETLILFFYPKPLLLLPPVLIAELSLSGHRWTYEHRNLMHLLSKVKNLFTSMSLSSSACLTTWFELTSRQKPKASSFH